MEHSIFSNTKVWFTPSEAALFLGKSTKWIQRQSRARSVSASLLKGTTIWRYHRSTLEALKAAEVVRA